MSSSTTSPPVASISGNTMGNALSAEETALPFVDRNIEIELLIRWARFNACNRTSLKPTTLFSSQLFGSGKTYFAHNAIGYLRKDFASRGPITTSLICPGAVAPEDDRCDLSLLRNQPSSPFTEELVSQYANSGTVIVDVSRMESLPGATFDTVLVYYIASKVTGRDPAALFREHYCDTLAQLHEKMQAIKEGYWFICFDEIGALEDKAIQRHFSLEEFNCYSPLLTFLQKLLDVSDYKIFFFLCGRSWKLIQITLGKTLNSPVRLRYLALGALSVKDIETILRASPICVYIKEDEFTSISQTLFNLSGGVPRFIQLMYLALLADARNRGRSSVTQILLSAKEVEAKLHPSSKFGGDIMDNTSLVTDTVSSSASQEELAMHETTLLRLYILGALIPSREVVSILSVFPCYITPVGDAFKPIFSPYWIEKMKSRDHISVPALNLSSLLKTAPPALDQGRIFELLGAEVISSRLLLAQQRTFGGALSFLQDTVLGGVHISERASPDSPVLFPLGVVPSLNVCTTPGEPTEHSFNAEDWDLFITHLEQNWINHIALASSAPSHGPDLLIPLACCPDGNNVLFGDEARKITHIVEFAFKNIQGGVADAKDMQSWSHIRKEVAKCLDAPRKCGAKTSGVHFTLVFISTELTSAVFKVIQRYQSPALVLRSTDDGRKWRVSGSELVEVSYEEASFDIAIPSNCELVILGASAVETLFGEELIESLKRHFKGASIEDYFESLKHINPHMLNLGEVVRKRPPPSHDLCQPLPKVSRAGINKVECLARCLPSLQDTTQLARLTGFIEETPELKFFAENAPITPGKAQELLVNATMKKAETEVTRVKAMLQQYLTTLETNKKVVEDCIAFLEICPLNYQVLHALSRVSQPITAIPVIQTLMSQ